MTATDSWAAVPAAPWRLRIQHRTGFRYAGEVVSSYNEARVTPRTSGRQTALETSLVTDPAASAFRYTDYWGSAVTAFDVHVPHRELAVVAGALVEVTPTPEPEGGAGWAELADPSLVDRMSELLAPTDLTALDDALRGLADDARGAKTPREAAHRLAAGVHEVLAYDPTATDVSTTAATAWYTGRGVCQDYTHVLLAALRRLGIPARYVSGYLHPRPSAGIGETVAGESHAWVEWWDGAWNAWDPTNGAPARQGHVVVARGRDYADVPPLRGIYSGPRSSALGVTVEVTRIA